MGKITNRVPSLSPSISIGSLGATELLFTTLSTATGSDSVWAVLATISLTGTELQIVADLAGVLFFGYAVYEFLSRVYPEELTVVTDRLGYRVFAVFFTVGGSEIFGDVFASGSTVSSDNILFLIGGAISLVVVCIGYIAIIDFRDIANIKPASRVVSERLTVSGSSAEANDTETRALGDRLSDITYVGVMTAAPLPFLVQAVFGAGLLFPVPEGLAIGWGVIGVVDARFDQDVRERLPDRERTNLQNSALDLVVNVVRSAKGIPTVLLIIQGFGGAVAFSGAMISTLPRFTQEGLTAIRSDPLFAWSSLGMVLVFFGSGLFAVWFWARVIRRVPAYLQAWNTSKSEESPVAEESLPEPVTRPVGLLLPFLVTVLPAMAFVQCLRFDYFFGLRTPLLIGYGIVWPLSIVVLGWTVYRTRQTDPQSSFSDGRALPAALLIEWGVIFLLQPIAGYVRQSSGVRFSSSTQGVEILSIVIVLGLLIFIYPDLEARANGAEGWQSQQHNLFLFGVGLASAVGVVFNVGSIGSSGLILGIFAALFMGAPAWNVVTDIVL